MKTLDRFVNIRAVPIIGLSNRIICQYQ